MHIAHRRQRHALERGRACASDAFRVHATSARAMRRAVLLQSIFVRPHSIDQMRGFVPEGQRIFTGATTGACQIPGQSAHGLAEGVANARGDLCDDIPVVREKRRVVSRVIKAVGHWNWALFPPIYLLLCSYISCVLQGTVCLCFCLVPKISQLPPLCGK